MDRGRPPHLGYGPCDSYFIEGDDGRTAFLDPRERARLIARERQLAIAEDLSRAVAEEYQDDVLAHMEHMEMYTLPDVSCIDTQTEIEWFMRPYLLDFLIEAHQAFQLLPETLFLTINLLDRYCSKRVVYKRHYQLVGCASLLVAAKYGDRKDRVPTLSELKSMCCSTYDSDMFQQMEWHVLQTLDWTIGHPTVDGFLQLAVADELYDPEVEHMARYIAEVAVFHKEFVSTRPSVLARVALTLARCILGRPAIPETVWAGEYHSFTAAKLSSYLHRPSQAVSRKYASSRFSSVAVTMEVFLARQVSIARIYAPPSPVHELGPAPVQQQPHTPQKPGGLPSIPTGVLTPPITPDGDVFGTDETARFANGPPPVYPATPSPMYEHHEAAGPHRGGQHGANLRLH